MADLLHNLFNKLRNILNHTTLIHAETLNEQHAFSRTTTHPKSADCTLIVHKRQNAYLINEAGDVQHFTTGEYPLTAEAGSTIQIIFIHDHAHNQGTWQIEHHTGNLQGHYTLTLDKPHLLAQYLSQHPEYRQGSDLAKLISDHIAHALNNHPQDNLHEEHSRLIHYLNTTLTTTLKHRGITLQNFTLDDDTSPTPSIPLSANNNSTPPEAHPEATQAPPPQPHDEKADRKDYYHVHNGQQVGPYSLNELQQAIDKGNLKRHDLLWKKGMNSWFPAENIASLNFPK